MIVTVVKKVVNSDNGVILLRGDELDIDTWKGKWHGVRISDKQKVVLEYHKAAQWCVFRPAEQLFL